MTVRTAEQDRFRERKKAWKPPKAVRRVLLVVAFAAGCAIVGWEVLVAVRALGGGA